MTIVAHTPPAAQAPAATCVASLDWDAVYGPAPLPPTPRQGWRAHVAQAQAALECEYPGLVGRIRAAAKIVLADDVIPGDGRFTVGSQSDAGLRYVVDGQCDCRDAERVEGGRCKHWLAVALLTMARQAAGRATPAAQKETTVHEPTEQDEWISAEAEVTPAPTPTPATEPYAPSTLCLKARVGEIELSWTLRGSDEDVAARAQRVLAYVARLQQAKAPEAPAPPPAAPAQDTEGWCPIHQTWMKKQHNARGAWWSHQAADGWCKGGPKN
jgi:hypothetical protein